MPVIIREHVKLAQFTTINLGGPASFFAECLSVDDVCEALAFADSHQLKIHVLGGGSNTIFLDEGFPGLVLKMGMGYVRSESDRNTVRFTAGGGVVWDDCVLDAVHQGAAGIECLSGIPGTVGASPIQNIGAYGQEVKDTIESLCAVDRLTLKPVIFSAAECEFGYRQSRFKSVDRGRYVITEVTYRLRKGGTPEIRYPELQKFLDIQLDVRRPGDTTTLLESVRNAVLQLRHSKSMVFDPTDENARSVGSFFMNPVLTPDQLKEFQSRVAALGKKLPNGFPADDGVKIPAAWLIEQAGFQKGYTKNGAAVSSRHALALVNKGCTTRDILNLAEEIERGVRETFGISLEREGILAE
ncbi:MAG: UDP-N-acetylmuramate dehydrogenase [Ignavibacteriales bacterium]|nr:UDP-N-acetylmuramate dehydrogenase [Ignavibacteriales bacterium]